MTSYNNKSKWKERYSQVILIMFCINTNVAFEQVVVNLLNKFNRLRVHYVVIGSYALELLLDIPIEWKDFDVYAWDPDPLKDYEFYEEILLNLDLLPSLHTHGIVALTQDNIPIEVIAPIGDFAIPLSILKKTINVNWKGIEVKTLEPEAIAVLKARAGRRLDYEQLRLLKNRLKTEKLHYYILSLGEADYIKRATRVLREVGLLE